MTLADVLNKLDWSSIDAQHQEWYKIHPDAKQLDPERITKVREGQVARALMAIGIIESDKEWEIGFWYCLPQTIRDQIEALLEVDDDGQANPA